LDLPFFYGRHAKAWGMHLLVLILPVTIGVAAFFFATALALFIGLRV
jgi:hypothetical protein